ncbi:MAG: M28 family peptidase [Anaerolineae bacterium]|nr:M28 family peptidase [Anaerolineae bacterium]
MHPPLLPLARAKVLLAILLPLLAAGCSLLSPPPRPVVPTPAPAVVDSGNAVAFSSLRTDAGPANVPVPGVDQSLLGLIGQVSRQNLYAYVQTLQNFGTRHTLSAREREGYGIGAAARWIHDEFERVGAGRIQVGFHEFTMDYGGRLTNQQNVVARLPGEGEHKGLLVLTAYYDSRGSDADDPTVPAPGANSNASGVALLLETARLLSARGWQQEIVFIAFAGGEQENTGTRRYVQEVMLDGVVIDAAINVDTVGGRAGVPRSMLIFAAPENPGAGQLARYFDLITRLYLPEFPVELRPMLDRQGRSGDHASFAAAGIPAIRISESQENSDIRHTAADTADRLDYDYLVQMTQLVVAAVANMVAAPPVPAAPAVAPMAAEGTYLLSWTTQPHAASYAVAFRIQASEERILRYIGAAEAGEVVLTGLNPGYDYAISVAPIDSIGHIGLFSEEVVTSQTAAVQPEP